MTLIMNMNMPSYSFSVMFGFNMVVLVFMVKHQVLGILEGEISPSIPITIIQSKPLLLALSIAGKESINK